MLATWNKKNLCVVFLYLFNWTRNADYICGINCFLLVDMVNTECNPSGWLNNDFAHDGDDWMIDLEF